MKPLECVEFIKHVMDMGISSFIVSVQGVQGKRFNLEIQIWDRKGSVVVKSDDIELIRLIVHHFKRQKFIVVEDHPTFVRVYRQRSQ